MIPPENRNDISRIMSLTKKGAWHKRLDTLLNTLIAYYPVEDDAVLLELYLCTGLSYKLNDNNHISYGFLRRIHTTDSRPCQLIPILDGGVLNETQCLFDADQGFIIENKQYWPFMRAVTMDERRALQSACSNREACPQFPRDMDGNSLYI